MKVGIVGLGRMGAAMSQRLRQHGCEVVGWDHKADATRAAAADGLRIATNARDVAAQSDVVISIITEDHGVRRIFNGPDGFLDGAVTGKLFIDMSTLQPMTGRELAPLVEAKGARFLEAPVLGTIPQVRAGTLFAMVGGHADDLHRARPVLGTIPQVRAGTLFAMVGGRAEDVDRARPVLEKMTRRIVHMGPNGSGYAMKLAVNLGLGAYIQAVSESLALGLQQGLTLDQMLDVLQEAPYASGWLKSKLDVLKGAPAEMTLDIRTLRKDLMSAVATGALSGVPMPLSAAVLTSLSAAVADDYGGGDLAELPKFLREAMLQNFA